MLFSSYAMYALRTYTWDTRQITDNSRSDLHIKLHKREIVECDAADCTSNAAMQTT